MGTNSDTAEVPDVEQVIRLVERDLRHHGLAAFAATGAPGKVYELIPIVLIRAAALGALLAAVLYALPGRTPALATGLVNVALSLMLVQVAMQIHRRGRKREGRRLRARPTIGARLTDFVGWLVACTLLFGTAVGVATGEWLIAFALAIAAAIVSGLAYEAYAAGVAALVRVGIPSLVYNATRSIRAAGRTTLEAAGRAVPVTFAVLIVAFFTDDAWKVVHAMGTWRYLGLVFVLAALTVFTATAVAIAETRSVIASAGKAVARAGVEQADPPPEYVDLLQRHSALRGVEPLVPASDMTDWQRRNLTVALTAATLGRVLTVWVLVGVIFLVVGVIAVGDETISTLLGANQPRATAWDISDFSQGGR